MIDLAYKGPEYSMAASIGEEDEEKDRYPELCIKDKPGLAASLKVGQEYTVTMKVKVTGIKQKDPDECDDWECESEVTLSVRSLDIPGVKMKEEPDEEDAGSALNKFAKNKKPMTDTEDED